MSKEWKEYKFSNLNLLAIEDGDRGKNYPKKSEFNDTGYCLFLNTGNVRKNGFNFSSLEFISRERDELLRKGKLRRDDVVLTTRGTVGNVGFFNQHVSHNHVRINSGMVILRPNIETIYPNFLYQYVKSKLFSYQVLSLVSGSAQPQLPIRDLKSIRINLPPLQEQKAIAHVLGTLDDKIELNRKMNETLEAMAQAMFKSWFVDFDPVLDNALAQGNTIPDALQAKAERRKAVLASGKYKALPAAIQGLFPASFVYNEELGKWIPEGWESSSIGKEFNVTMGQSPPSSTYNETEIGIPFFQGKTDFGFRFPTNRIFCTEPKRLANKNDTLISVRAPVGSANLAHCNCAIGRGVAALRHKSLSISYTYQTVLNLKSKFDVFEGEGTVFGSINQSDLKALGVVKSNKQIIKTFDFYCSKLDKRIELNSHDINTLTKTRDLLLSQLISGKTRLPESFVQQF